MWRRSPVVGLVAGATLLWACSCSRPRGTGARPTDVPVQGRPQRLVAYDGKALASVFGAKGGVAIVDPVTRQVEAELPAHPKHLVGALAVALDKLFVDQPLSDAILVYDLRTRKRIHSIPIGGGGAMVAAADGKQVYFGHNTENAFYIIDTSTYEHRRVAYPKIPAGQGTGCLAAAIAADGARLYLGIHKPTPFLAVYSLKEGRYEAPASKSDDGRFVDRSTP